ncbi:hypothetical protein NDU88_000691 [Pleurodeles waltl]|uniref:Uncharacterized protein n=1 Tax=Pleurodeles waltl TaxID=8319 RepID=A0AAV7ML91_PLEWA|nr:hypothetical protein NDU88_000691 [Pleurodeles waltl]
MENGEVCVGFAPSHTGLGHYFPLCVDFRHTDLVPRQVVGFSGASGMVRGFLGLCSDFTSAALIQWALCGMEVGLRCPRSAVHQSGEPCVEVSVATQALRRSSPCEVGLHRSGSVCSEFFTAMQAVHHFSRLCVKFSPHKESSCRSEVFLVLRLQGTGGNLHPSPWRALLNTAREQQGSRATARQQSFSEKQPQ